MRHSFKSLKGHFQGPNSLILLTKQVLGLLGFRASGRSAFGLRV